MNVLDSLIVKTICIENIFYFNLFQAVAKQWRTSLGILLGDQQTNKKVGIKKHSILPLQNNSLLKEKNKCTQYKGLGYIFQPDIYRQCIQFCCQQHFKHGKYTVT